jgi:hypothetical protein
MRGPSKLQWRILAAIDSIGVATSADLLERVCGWKARGQYTDAIGRPCEPKADERRLDGGLVPGHLLAGGHYYFRGYPRAQRVALSRAVRRLEARGLVDCGEGPIPCPAKGYTTACRITVTPEGRKRLTEFRDGVLSTVAGETAA